MVRPQLKLIQKSKYRWELVGPKGDLLLEDGYFTSVYAASEWCNAFISSHPHWSYVIIELEDI